MDNVANANYSMTQFNQTDATYNGTFPSFSSTTIVTVTVCSAGMLANSLVILVVLFGSLQKSVFMNLLMLLAISENFYLLTIIENQRGIFGKILVSPSVLHCRLNVFFAYVSGTASSWITVLISLDRFIAVFFPLKVHIYCTKKRTYKTVLFIFALASMASAPFLFTCSVFNVGGLPVCRISGSDALYDLILTVTGCLFYSIAPCLIITILNILIMKKIKSWRAFQSRSLGLKQTSKDSSLVTMMISVCIVFAVTSFPGSIVKIHAYSCSFIHGKRCMSNEDRFSRIAFMLDDINHSINFFLYCITGLEFRSTVCQILTCKKRQSSRHQSHPMAIISQTVA